MRLGFGVQSLTLRVVLSVSVWAVAGLVVIAIAISTLYRRDAEKSFRELLRAHLFNVVNSVSIDENKQLAGRPELGDLQFSQPGTGWYWIAEGVGQYKTTPLVSPSLGATPLPEKPVSEAPFDIRFQRYYDLKDALGNSIAVAETEVELDDQGDIVRFRVTGNKAVVEQSVQAFNRSLILALVIFGAGSLLANALAILIGLRPLDRVRNALENIRGGKAERLEGRFPKEIQPLAHEVNALIDNNRRIIERARMQVGNLAHSLKTPLAVLLNEARTMTPAHGALVSQQAEAMQSQVQSYLNRARIAAQRETVLARTEARPVLDRLVRVMQKLNREIDFSIEDEMPGALLAMEQQDIEEIVGNLLENAARFAKSSIRLTLVSLDDEGARERVELAIEDDGPGLDPDQIKEAMKRGKRLDESRPGSGLGLSIVSEIVAEYDGRFTLTRGAGGGLRAILILPVVAQEKPKRG
jgi:signal transduction histidine kinase